MTTTKAALMWAALSAISVLGAQDKPPECREGEEFQFEVQVSLNGGQNWYSDSVVMFAYPGTRVDFAVRTRMTVVSGETEGWSFSLKHDPTGLQSSLGDLAVTGVTVEGTDTETVQGGNPPDFESTEIREGFYGYTQGVVIDTESQITLPPVADFVTSFACYRINVPAYTGLYEIPIIFTNDIGQPPIDSVVSQEGQAIEPCAKNMTIHLYAGSFWVAYPPCTIGGAGTSEVGAGQVGLDATQGGAKYADPIHYWVAEVGNPTHSAGEAGDFDKDGDLDLVATKIPEGPDRGDIVIMWNDGNGNFPKNGWTEILVPPRGRWKDGLGCG